jgi:predicted TIM-barrel fold metal-dependent hydrolase
MSGIGGMADSATAPRVVARMRQLGVSRILFGSDGAVQGNSPLVTLRALRRLPLTKGELRTIERNVPPYMRW